ARDGPRRPRPPPHPRDAECRGSDRNEPSWRSRPRHSALAPRTFGGSVTTTAPPLTLFGSLRWDVVRRVFPPGPARVLEIGCGQGAVGARLAAAGHDYTGVELDGASADVAAARLTDAGLPGQVVHGSVEALV